MIIIAIIIAAVLVLVGFFAAFRLSKLFEPRQRLVFWIVVALAAAYFAPRLVTGFASGYRTGAELRQQQGS
jgi:ABC-type glycerol-3-phosphate transport system permease component